MSDLNNLVHQLCALSQQDRNWVMEQTRERAKIILKTLNRREFGEWSKNREACDVQLLDEQIDDSRIKILYTDKTYALIDRNSYNDLLITIFEPKETKNE